MTAFYSTGISNIEVYMAAPWATRTAAKLSRPLTWLLGSRPVLGWLTRRVQAGPSGPTEEERRQGKSLLWGEVTDDAGRKAVSRLVGPESYDWTVQTALAVTGKVLNGIAVPGFQTPSMVFGADFVLECPGVVRSDE